LSGVRRLLLVAVVAVVAFAAALFSFDEDARQGCAVETEPDPAYSVELLTTPSIREVVYRLAVTRSGQPVTGARV
jgi:hypothetical protein